MLMIQTLNPAYNKIVNFQQMLLENLNSPTYSLNENALRLNSSSIASSTPNCSDIKWHYVHFEQYQCLGNIEPNKIAPNKKKLTIQIDQHFDFQPNSDKIHADQQTQQIPTPTSSLTNDFNNNIIIEMQAKIYLLQQKLHLLQQSKKQKTFLAERIQKQKSEIMKQNQSLKTQIRKKDEMINSYQQKNDELIYEVAQLDQLRVEDRYYDEKLRQKQTKIKELQKLYDKIVIMNKILQKDLRQSDNKIMQLGKQIQKSVCTTQYENMAKIKQSSMKLKQSSLKLKQMHMHVNKENATISNGAKSLDKKKTVGSQGKKIGRTPSSSTTNFNKKLQIKT